MPALLDDILFDLGKIIEGAIAGDRQKVAAYGIQLSDKLDAAGENAQARKIRKILDRSNEGKFELAEMGAESLPTDLDSSLPIADHETFAKGDVQVFLPPKVLLIVENFIKCFKAADRLRARGVGISASMLMFGPPGCGKTQLAKWISSELSLPLITARTDGLISSYLGSTAKNIRALFDYAMSRPCALFLDEFDAIAKMRDDARELGELKRVVISLLQNIDAMNRDHVLLAATNHEHLLDKAIWRRFGYTLHLSGPDETTRKKMLVAFLANFGTDEVVDTLLAMSQGLTGAQLRTIADECIRMSVLEDKSHVSVKDAVHVALATHPDGASGNVVTVQEQARMLRRLNRKVFTESRLSIILDKSQSQIHRYLQENGDGER
jgi:SpoVK/Ycf46/Vps4 family AAA+-type ATPase